MAAGLKHLAPEVVAISPRLEPHLVEVVVWYPFGAADEAVAAATAKVEELLAAPDLGAAFAKSPDADEDSPRVATAAMVQAVARLVLEQAREIASAAVADLMTKPGVLSGMLPAEPPADAETPWLNGGVLAVTPKA